MAKQITGAKATYSFEGTPEQLEDTLAEINRAFTATAGEAIAATIEAVITVVVPRDWIEETIHDLVCESGAGYSLEPDKFEFVTEKI